jgi:glycerophosphoryl diester phosphodiesterase
MRINLTILLFICMLSACTKERVLTHQTLNVGHGGAGFLTYRNNVPPNTTEAFHRGFFIEGADAVEMDIQLTHDSIAILFHDTELDEATDCYGCVSKHDFEEIKNCRIGTRNGPLDGDFTIPALDEVFDLLENTDAVLFLNVKSHDPCIQDELKSYQERFARVLSRMIGERNLYQRTFIETLDIEFLQTCRAADSSFRFIYDCEDFESGLRISTERNYFGFAILNERVTAAQIQSAHDSGKMLIIWGVKLLAATKQAVAKNPDAIMTDDVRMLRQVLDE